MSIDTSNNLLFHYLVRDSLCYLTLTEKSYPKRLAFLYLEEIADAFIESMVNDYGDPGWRDAIATTATDRNARPTDDVVSESITIS